MDTIRGILARGLTAARNHPLGMRLEELWRDTRGATAVIFSLLTVVTTGMVAMGIDTATWYNVDRKLQTGADMAAMAAAGERALQNAANYSGDSVETIARNLLERAGVDLTDVTTLTVNSPPSIGNFIGDANAVEIIASQDVPIFFAGFFVSGTPQAQARAVARAGADGDVCVLALHPTLSAAVFFSGSSDVQADCGIGANSTASDAVDAQGSTDVQVTNVRAVGGIDGESRITGSLSPYANPVQDPFADAAVPAFGGCDSNGVNANGNATQTLTPGVYCGDVRLNAQSNTTFNSGTYILDDADLIINGQADVHGDEVTFIFTNSGDPSDPGRLQLNGGSNIQLTGPTSGNLQDLIFFRDPAGADVAGNNSERWIINGSSDLQMLGAAYAPGAEVTFSGSSDMGGQCLVVVAGAVSFTGSTDYQMDCMDDDVTMAGAITTTLVE